MNALLFQTAQRKIDDGQWADAAELCLSLWWRCHAPHMWLVEQYLALEVRRAAASSASFRERCLRDIEAVRTTLRTTQVGAMERLWLNLCFTLSARAVAGTYVAALRHSGAIDSVLKQPLLYHLLYCMNLTVDGEEAPPLKSSIMGGGSLPTAGSDTGMLSVMRSAMVNSPTSVCEAIAEAATWTNESAPVIEFVAAALAKGTARPLYAEWLLGLGCFREASAVISANEKSLGVPP